MKTLLNGMALVVQSKPYNGYMYNMEEVQKWKEEHYQQKLESLLPEKIRSTSDK